MKTVLLILLLCPAILRAQLIKITPNDIQRKHSYLIMRDGSIVRGQIIRQDSTVITVRKRDGDMTFVEADQIIRISTNRPDNIAVWKLPDSKSPRYTVFVFKDGTQVEGSYIRRDSTMITVRKRNGQLTYFEPELLARVDTIRSGSALSNMDGSDQVFANRFSPWLLTGQTAYNAEKGRFYYRNTLGLLNEFDYGITRNWSVGASFVVSTAIPYISLVNFYAFNGFLPTNSRLFTKLSVPLGNKFRLGLNVVYQDKLHPNYTRGVLTYQALASIGTSQRNVTLGFGLIDRGKQRFYVYPISYTSPTTVDVPIPNQSFLTLGIMQKVSPWLTLISDNRINLGSYYYNYYDNTERASVSFALRFDRRRHAFDVGLYSLVYRDTNKWDDQQVRILFYMAYNLLIGRK